MFGVRSSPADVAETSHLVPPSVLKFLSHRTYEKRKKAAQQIELLVRRLCSDGDHERIDDIVCLLLTGFMGSSQSNNRQGGLLGLAAVTVGLCNRGPQHLPKIMAPVFKSFDDQDYRVRYFACEALYNIVKVIRERSMSYFREIFIALCKLVADSDTNIQCVACILDELVKDIVTQSDEFSVEEFIELLQVHMQVSSPRVRQYLVGWITVLYDAPEIDMICWLPDFLDGLINMLSDERGETRHIADVALSTFLMEIKNYSHVDYKRVIKILVQRASSHDEYTRLVAITWINELGKLRNKLLVPCYPDIIGAILACISDEEEKIRVLAFETNEELRAICANPSIGVNIRSILLIIKRQLCSTWEATRTEALLWLSMVLKRNRLEVIALSDFIFDSLLSALSDVSDKIVLQVLEVLVCLANDAPYFHRLIVYLVYIFKNNKTLLEKRGILIICHLCVHLDAERVYREFAIILKEEKELDFASTMVQATYDSTGKKLFFCLYACWSHSPMATISLCLLTQAYYTVTKVIESLEEDEINKGFMIQTDKLIRLLETPTFAYLRLQLLEPSRYPWLLKSLYGLLMLLPQKSSAFSMLQIRLKILPCSNFDQVIKTVPADLSLKCSTKTKDNYTQAKTQSQSPLQTPTVSIQEKQNLRTRRMMSALNRAK